MKKSKKKEEQLDKEEMLQSQIQALTKKEIQSITKN